MLAAERSTTQTRELRNQINDLRNGYVQGIRLRSPWPYVVHDTSCEVNSTHHTIYVEYVKIFGVFDSQFQRKMALQTL